MHMCCSSTPAQAYLWDRRRRWRDRKWAGWGGWWPWTPWLWWWGTHGVMHWASRRLLAGCAPASLSHSVLGPPHLLTSCYTNVWLAEWWLVRHSSAGHHESTARAAKRRENSFSHDEWGSPLYPAAKRKEKRQTFDHGKYENTVFLLQRNLSKVLMISTWAHFFCCRKDKF